MIALDVRLCRGGVVVPVGRAVARPLFTQIPACDIPTPDSSGRLAAATQLAIPHNEVGLRDPNHLFGAGLPVRAASLQHIQSSGCTGRLLRDLLVVVRPDLHR